MFGVRREELASLNASRTKPVACGAVRRLSHSLRAGPATRIETYLTPFRPCENFRPQPTMFYGGRTPVLLADIANVCNFLQGLTIFYGG